MPIELNGKTYYRTAEACKLAGISRATLFRWLKANIIENSFCVDRRGWKLFSAEDIARLKTEVTKISPMPHSKRKKRRGLS